MGFLNVPGRPAGYGPWLSVALLTDGLPPQTSGASRIAQGADDARRHAVDLLHYIGGIGVVKPH